MKVSAVAEELSSMVLVADMQRVAAQQMQKFGKDLCTAPWDIGWRYRWRAQQTPSIKSGKDLARRAEEDSKAETEEVGRVAGLREDVFRDLEMALAYLNEDLGLEKLVN